MQIYVFSSIQLIMRIILDRLHNCRALIRLLIKWARFYSITQPNVRHHAGNYHIGR